MNSGTPELRYQWIRTRDGSPTLWCNEKGESFRSVKGAFTESWTAFVEPALKAAAILSEAGRPLVVGEFGLGPGTNWWLWQLASRARGLESNYFVVEKDPASFELGLQEWEKQAPVLRAFFESQGIPLGELPAPSSLPRPTIYSSLAEALSQQAGRAQLWFHDPFGYDVNPDGYSPSTLSLSEKLWASRFWGGSYACSRHFQRALQNLCVDVNLANSGSVGLKRERLEFSRGLHPPSTLRPL